MVLDRVRDRKNQNYKNKYTFKDLRTMRDFVENEDSVEALCWGYREFDFSRPQPINYRSPFWQAFREIQQWDKSGVIWDNLSRCDYKGGSILEAGVTARQELSKLQMELLPNEINILAPHACLFFTGPYYDEFLSAVFPDCQFMPAADDIPVREFARIIAPNLPRNSFRTYHPNFLRQGNRWHYLDRLHGLVISEG